jgi:lysozyme
VEAIGNQNGKELMHKVEVWLKLVKKELKHEPLIYSGHYFLTEHLEPNFKRSHRLWVADYQKGYQFSQEHDLVFAQYSQKGKEKGIHGKVDLDWFEGTFKELRKLVCK